MGADIHLVVEVSDDADFNDVRGVAFAEWPRHTALFVAMAGLWGNECRFPPRGFPRRCSSLAAWNYGAIVCSPEELEDWAGEQPAIVESEALEHVVKGGHFLPPPHEPLVSRPCFSDASWLTLAELSEVISSLNRSTLSLECRATLALMEYLDGEDVCSRVVFWFDL